MKTILKPKGKERNTKQNRKISNIAYSNDLIDIVKELESDIKEYKHNAEQLATLLKMVETQRTQIINKIEEATYNGLSKGTAGRLEDKLSRPYSMLLFKQ